MYLSACLVSLVSVSARLRIYCLCVSISPSVSLIVSLSLSLSLYLSLSLICLSFCLPQYRGVCVTNFSFHPDTAGLRPNFCRFEVNQRVEHVVGAFALRKHPRLHWHHRSGDGSSLFVQVKAGKHSDYGCRPLAVTLRLRSQAILCKSAAVRHSRTGRCRAPTFMLAGLKRAHSSGLPRATSLPSPLT